MNDQEIFEEEFYANLEKGFSADIACCDYCHDEFVELWPLANIAENFEFQKSEVDLDWFYKYSYLQQFYTFAQFQFHISQMECPRCTMPLEHNIWAYNLPFDIPHNFETIIKDVSFLAKSTPFLLLDHHYCKSVFDAIKTLNQSCEPIFLASPLFRARENSKGDLLELISSFDFPPIEVVKEGRYNHAGNPVLYLASDKETCHSEIRNAVCTIVELELSTKIRILDLTDPYSKHNLHHDLLNSLVYSALTSAPHNDEGWHKPYYVVSRFVADCAKSAGFDAIKYPSTRRHNDNYNLVIVNQSLRLEGNSRVIAYHHFKN